MAAVDEPSADVDEVEVDPIGDALAFTEEVDQWFGVDVLGDLHVRQAMLARLAEQLPPSWHPDVRHPLDQRIRWRITSREALADACPLLIGDAGVAKELCRQRLPALRQLVGFMTIGVTHRANSDQKREVPYPGK